MARNKTSNGNGGSHITIHKHSQANRANIPEATQVGPGVPRAKRPVYRFSPHLSPKLRFDASGDWDRVKSIVDKAIAGQRLSPEEAEILRAAAEQGSQPWLEWANKQETESKGSFSVDDVVLHVHERVSAKAIIAAVQRVESTHEDLFARPQLHKEQSLQFYRHNIDWANRLVLGDSLQVMSSLANRENLAGKVQTIYMDPPYGIKFSSNWQNEVSSRNVKDKDEDLTREPEMIKAYRDTWSLGVHSYLTYLKQRLLVMRELLTEDGSLFLQISDENLHLVRTVLDEVFGTECFQGIICFSKTTGLAKSKSLPSQVDFILWYTKGTNPKFRPLFRQKDADEAGFNSVELQDGSRTGMMGLTASQIQGLAARRFMLDNLTKPGPGAKYDFEFQDRVFHSGNRWWGTPKEAMRRLARAERLAPSGDTLRYVRYFEDFSMSAVTNLWLGVGGAPKPLYVVQTNEQIVEMCLLMTSDPGDLVLDPTAGSGTTAAVAEHWGRRWITIDSSRIAVSITRQRLLTASFPSFKTRDPAAGVDPALPQNPAYGFHYKTTPRVSPTTIAQNQNLDPILDKHEPLLLAALERLNICLEGMEASIVHTTEKLVQKMRTKTSKEGARAISDADLRRWLLPGTEPGLITFGTEAQRARWRQAIPTGPGWKEWEVPFDSDPDWPEELEATLLEYRKAWRRKMNEVNACVSSNAEQEELVDQPDVVHGITRVSGPFSVEGVRPEELALGEDGKLYDPTANDSDELSAANADGYIDLMISLLKRDGVTFLGNRRAGFASLEKEAGKSFHALGSWKDRGEGPPAVAVVFGPQYGPVNARLAVEAIEAARGLKEITDLVIAGFSFDAAAQQKAKELDSPAFRVHLAHIRPDVSPGMQGLLKETPNSQLFTVFGQPDIKVLPAGDGEYKVEMNGVCIYNPLTGEISDSARDKVAAWFLDTDYDGACFCFSQAFFPDKTAWEKIAKALGTSVPEGAFQAFTTSWPFKPGKHNRIAVKVIDPRGNEVMAIKTLQS